MGEEFAFMGYGSFSILISPTPSSCVFFFFFFFSFLLPSLNVQLKHLSFLDRRQEKLRTEAAEASTGTGSAGPTRHPTEEMDADNQPSVAVGAGGDAEGGKDGKDGKDHSQHPPAKRYRLTDTMKSMVWELVLLSNECCRLENEKK